MRNKKGQFTKGYTYRKPKPYWDRNWLWEEYREKKKSAKQIAEEQGCEEMNIIYFLRKLNIPRWTMKEEREFFSSMQTRKKLGEIIEIANKETTYEAKAQKFLELLQQSKE